MYVIKEIRIENDASEHSVVAFHDQSVHKKTKGRLEFEFKEEI